MLIPIAHEEQRVSRLPWITILLLVANVAAFLLTAPVVNQHAAQNRQRAQEVLRFAAEHPYLQMPKDITHIVRAGRPPESLSPETISEEQARLDRLWDDFKATPDNIEARTSLIEAYVRKGNHAAAGRESARLVGAYLKARDTAGAMSAAREHKQAFPDVPLLVRDQLALADDCKKRQEYQEAASRYQEAIATGPDDPMAPKALVGYGWLLLQVFKEPAEALKILERARKHPQATPEFQQASAEMIAAAKQSLSAAPGSPSPEPPSPSESAHEPAHHLSPAAISTLDRSAVQTPDRTPDRSLAPVLVHAVGINGRGLTLQVRRGKTGQLQWEKIAAVSVARIGRPEAKDHPPDALILDLILSANALPTDGQIRCLRLSAQDVDIPQLQNEPSPLRAFQRLVATVLKATGATAHPSREACMGVPRFPAFPNLMAYEADLVPRLSNGS